MGWKLFRIKLHLVLFYILNNIFIENSKQQNVFYKQKIYNTKTRYFLELEFYFEIYFKCFPFIIQIIHFMILNRIMKRKILPLINNTIY